MDIDALNAFIAVAKHASFSVAAQHLHLTQPAVSKRINSLEQELDHILFNRSAKDITLTEAGEHLLPKAIHILQAVEETKNAISSLSGEVAGTLKIATSHHIGLHHLPPILRIFASQYPQVNLQIEFLDSEIAYKKVINGECDLAVVTLAPNSKQPIIESKIIWQDPLHFVAAKNHVLFNLNTITLKDLSESSAILPDLNTYTGRIAKRFFDTQKLPIKMNMTTNYLETIKMMVSVGLGWSLLPTTLIDNNLEIIPIDNVALHRELGVIINKRRKLSNATKVFHDILWTETQNNSANKDIHA